jgi:hypothetical protein
MNFIKILYNKYKKQIILTSKIIGGLIAIAGNILAWFAVRDSNLISNAIQKKEDIEWRKNVDSLLITSNKKTDILTLKVQDIYNKLDTIEFFVLLVERKNTTTDTHLKVLEDNYLKTLIELKKLDQVIDYQKTIITLLKPEVKVSIYKLNEKKTE